MSYRESCHQTSCEEETRGEAHGIEEWNELLTPLMGAEARERYEYMCSGSVILLPVEVFGAKSIPEAS